MIKRILIENFRSILKCDLTLTPLTVIVGANATGKSNLIKAIEFYSNSIKLGIQKTIYGLGGFKEITPKQHKAYQKLPILFEIESSLVPPTNWDKMNMPDIDISYKFQLRQSRNKASIENELLIIKEPLLYQHFIDEHYNLSTIKQNNGLDHYSNSSLHFEKTTPEDSIHVKLKFEKDYAIEKEITSWIGLNKLIGKNSNSRIELLSILEGLTNLPLDRYEELILSNVRTISEFAPQFRKILFDFSYFRKYDLFLNRLRSDQKISQDKFVSSEGDNLPSIAKQLYSEKNTGRWFSITNTMQNIAPYFVSVKNRQLPTGKEYLLFEEIFKGRPIESWDESDGTLRALAILMALETHPIGSTIMIEEPEHGMHPWALKFLIDHIREVIKERQLQVIITTHSPQILENIKHDELLIADRDIEKGTTFSKLKDIVPNIEPDMNEIGQLWVRGLLKGVPRYDL